MGLSDIFEKTEKTTIAIHQLNKLLERSVSYEYLSKMLKAGVKKSQIMEVLDIKNEKENENGQCASSRPLQ